LLCFEYVAELLGFLVKSQHATLSKPDLSWRLVCGFCDPLVWALWCAISRFLGIAEQGKNCGARLEMKKGYDFS